MFSIRARLYVNWAGHQGVRTGHKTLRAGRSTLRNMPSWRTVGVADLPCLQAVSERRLVGVSDVNASPAERVQRLLWINNKLQLSLRGLLALQCEWRRLAHRVRTHYTLTRRSS